MKYYSLFNVFCYLMLLLSGCGQEGPGTSSFTSDTKRYNHKGFEAIYPADWRLNDDGQEIGFAGGGDALISLGADRKVVFETSELSAISVAFKKTRPQNHLDYANDYINRNRLESSQDVSDFQKEKITILDYEGIKLNWTERILGVDLKAELMVLLFRAEPYPVLVRFYFLDDDIVNQNSNIIPFLEGISFDPDGVIL